MFSTNRFLLLAWKLYYIFKKNYIKVSHLLKLLADVVILKIFMHLRIKKKVAKLTHSLQNNNNETKINKRNKLLFGVITCNSLW